MSSESVGVLVYGGGVAAAATALELASRGKAVTLCGPVPARCWPALPEAGINTGHDTEALARWTASCAGSDADREAVRAMAQAAPGIFEELCAMGVPFATGADGNYELRQLEGCDAADAAFVEGRTRPQVLSALDTQLLRRTALEQGVVRMEAHELLALVTDDDGRCVGAIVHDLVSQELHSLRADAVVLACGGPEKLFDGAGALCVEGGSAMALACGARFVDTHLVQLHPTALATGGDRLRLLSSAVRAESGRLWVPSDEHETRGPAQIPTAERDYFLEADGSDARATDDVCARAVTRVCLELGRGVYDSETRTNEQVVYLDVSHLPAGRLQERLASELDACALLTGVDPASAPLKVRAGASVSLGGLWVDDQHRSSVEGLYGVGEVGQRYHGSCRLGGNGLLAELHGARLCADAIAGAEVQRGKTKFKAAEKKAQKSLEALQQRQGEASIDGLHDRLRELMVDQLGPGAEYSELSSSDARGELSAIRADSREAGVNDGARHANAVRALRDFDHMSTIAELMLRHADEASDE